MLLFLFQFYHHFALGQNGYVYSYKYSYGHITMNITFSVKMLSYEKPYMRGLLLRIDDDAQRRGHVGQSPTRYVFFAIATKYF